MSDSPTDDELLQIKSCCDRFATACQSQAGDVALLDYLADVPPELQRHLLRELLRIRWRLRSDAGQVVSAERELKELPGWASEIRASLQAWQEERPVSAAMLHVDALVGRFRLLSRLSQGGFGSVWKAYDTSNEQVVTLKVAHAAAIVDPKFFLREVKATTALDHAHIVKVHEGGLWDGQCCIVCEYVDGESLAQLLPQQQLDIAGAVEIASTMADALSYLHAAGRIHRNISPQHILLSHTGRPMLTGVGWTQLLFECFPSATDNDQPSDLVYWSPELFRNPSHQTDARTDIYALGCVLYQMLTGCVPFDGSANVVRWQVLNREPICPTIHAPHIPINLAAICLRCLEKRPGDRYASAAELLAELKRFAAGKPTRTRRPGPIKKIARITRRHPVASFCLMLVASAVFVILGATLRSAQKLQTTLKHEQIRRNAAQINEAAAREASTLATEEVETGKQVMRFIEQSLMSPDPMATLLYGPDATIARETTVEELVRTAKFRVDRELVGQPRVQVRVWDMLAGAFRNLGDVLECEQMLMRSEMTLRDLGAEHPDLDLRVDWARHLLQRALLRKSRGNLDNAALLYKQAERIITTLDDELALADLYYSNHGFGQSLELRERHFLDSHYLVLLARIAYVQSQFRNSLEWNRVAESILTTLLGDSGRLAKLYLQVRSGRYGGSDPEAIAAIQEILAEFRLHVGTEGPVYALAVGEYAQLLYNDGRLRDALPYALEAIERGRHASPQHRLLYLATLTVAEELARAERFDESEGYFQQIDEMICDDPRLFSRATLSRADFLIRTGRPSEAKKLLVALDIPLQSLDQMPRLMKFMLLTEIGDADSTTFDALAHVERSFHRFDALGYSSASADLLTKVADLYAARGESRWALTLRRRALEVERRGRRSRHPRIADCLEHLASELRVQYDLGPALAAALEAAEIRNEQLPADDVRVERSRQQVAELQQLTHE
ncbi:MAG: serine/threonine protein kinase [Planctomycetales bacterium]|nr:serine/threonine protein kinase [Planctomycetales bacterium]MCA9169276.1 serine/threonine protein kinase [Planctomycetales bacterium]